MPAVYLKVKHQFQKKPYLQVCTTLFLSTIWLFWALFLLLAAELHWCGILKSGSGCWPLLQVLSAVPAPLAHGWLLHLTEKKYFALSAISILTKQNKKGIRNWIVRRVLWGLLCLAFKAHWSDLILSVQGEPWGFREFVNSHTLLLTRQNTKAILCPPFYSQFCCKFAHFSEDSLSFSRTFNYSNIRHTKSFLPVSYLQTNEWPQRRILLSPPLHCRKKLLRKHSFSLNCNYK